MISRLLGNQGKTPGLIASTITLLLISQAPWTISIFEAFTFAVALVVGARIRVFKWIFGNQSGELPKGGEWGSALIAILVWFVTWMLIDPRDRLIELVVALAIAHGFAKIGCARLGCCGWRNLSTPRGQIFEATLLLLLAGVLLVVAVFLKYQLFLLGLAWCGLLLLLRTQSMIAQSRTCFESGTLAILGIIFMAILKS